MRGRGVAMRWAKQIRVQLGVPAHGAYDPVTRYWVVMVQINATTQERLTTMADVQKLLTWKK